MAPEGEARNNVTQVGQGMAPNAFFVIITRYLVVFATIFYW